MEILFAIFVLAGLGGGTFWASTYYDKHATAKRALEIQRANKTEKEAGEISQKELQKLFDDARKAQQEEQKILADNWNQQFLELLPDTDPQKNAYNLKKAGIQVLEAEDLYPPDIPYTGEQLSYSERIVTKATAYVRNGPSDTTDFIATFQRGATIRVYGYARGRFVGKTDIWYQIKTKSFEGWIWSGSLNSSETKGLSRLEMVQRRTPRQINYLEQEAIKIANRKAQTVRWRS